MGLPYEVLTEIKGDNAIDHTPESETTPDFMNGKFNELLQNDKELYKHVVKKVEITENTDLNTLTDLNTEWITGTNGVAHSCLNTPYSSIPSFNVRNIPITYAGSSSYFRQFLNSFSGEIFYRDYDTYNKIYSNWIQVATVNMIADLQARVTNLENAI
jgi:hypothetical protein